ncbi:MAG: hypothetical protein LBJ00_14355, partial [Planctomycetaceae bacterium]|nr:hypothetical protein [Planctomycetaceae bacterium]
IFGNKIKEIQTLADFGKSVEFNFVTDINGLNTEKILKVDGKIDHANKYEVDTLNRISTVAQTVNNTSRNVNILYDSFGQLSQQTRLDSGKPIIVTKNKFDDSGQLINISHTGNNKTYADYDITWDKANRITDFDFTYLNGPAKKSESKYLYDKTSQLINASYNFMPNEKYDFDPNGNRKKAEIQGKKQEYETGEYNRLLSDENYRYEYDLEGNRITKTDKNTDEITKYFWDNRNRLVRVETPTDAIEYLYDYQNRLVKRTENITNQQYFIHDDWQIVLQFDNKNQEPTHRYLWGTKQDKLICDNDNWTLGDHLNSIRDIVKSDGNVVAYLEYNSFGKLISEIKSDLPFFAYTGKLTDKASDLQWNINRWYDSNVGKWVSEDPIGFKGSDANLYCYVHKLAAYSFDPSGTVIQFPVVAGGFLTGGNGMAVTWSAVSGFSTLYTIYVLVTSAPFPSKTLHDGSTNEPITLRIASHDIGPALRTIDSELNVDKNISLPDYTVCAHFRGYDKVTVTAKVQLFVSGLFENAVLYEETDSTVLTRSQLDTIRNVEGFMPVVFEATVILRVNYIEGYLFDVIEIESAKYGGIGVPIAYNDSVTSSCYARYGNDGDYSVD